MEDNAVAEQFTEEILNIIMDDIDDIIMIHDSEHTIVWMNRAGMKAFGVPLEKVIGERCYHLFSRNSCCEDCPVSSLVGGSKGLSTRTIPHTGIKYTCTSTPIMKDGVLKLVVQYLRRADCDC